MKALGIFIQKKTVLYCDFSKGFDTVFCNIVRDKLTKYVLDRWIVKWMENWLNG